MPLGLFIRIPLCTFDSSAICHQSYFQLDYAVGSMGETSSRWSRPISPIFDLRTAPSNMRTHANDLSPAWMQKERCVGYRQLERSQPHGESSAGTTECHMLNRLAALERTIQQAPAASHDSSTVWPPRATDRSQRVALCVASLAGTRLATACCRA